MNITITNVKNANELDSFIPVEGEWFIDSALDERSEITWDDIAESVKNYMDCDGKINVQIFASNGHEITNDIPANGIFLATRIR